MEALRAKRLFSHLEQECAHNILSTITSRHRSTAPTLTAIYCSNTGF